MSEEHLKAFLEMVKGDTDLQEKLSAATEADAVVSIAKTAGFTISSDDVSMTKAKVSDLELESAVGGVWNQLATPTRTGVLETGNCAGICEG